MSLHERIEVVPNVTTIGGYRFFSYSNAPWKFEHKISSEERTVNLKVASRKVWRCVPATPK